MNNVRVHYKCVVGNEELNMMKGVDSVEEMNVLQEELDASGAEIRFVEDMSMRPIVSRFMDVMKGLGVHFCSNSGIQYYYLQGRAYMYAGDMPSATEGVQIPEVVLRSAVQAHIHSLDEEARAEDLLYIEEKYTLLTGSPFGQMSIDDYIEGE